MTDSLDKDLEDYLTNLVKDIEREKLAGQDINMFKTRLEDYFSNIKGNIMEYKRCLNTYNVEPNWRQTRRSPLTFKKTDSFSVLVYAYFDTYLHMDEGFKEFFSPMEIAFLDDSGLYVASGPVKDDKLFVHYETLYLPEAAIQK